jgi:hypothetical protein
LVVATTDPAELPDLSTWYLVSNLPAPGAKRAEERGKISTADAAEVVRLYSLRSWIEQSYKQVKNSLGWAQYQVRKDLSIRRHWQLVCCAFTFCWWTNADFLEESPPGVILNRGEEEAVATSTPPPPPPLEERGKKEDQEEEPPAPSVLAGGAEEGKEVAGAIPNAMALLEVILGESPARGVKRVA